MSQRKPRASLYAVIGAGDLVVERIRATAAHVEGGSVSTDWRELPVQATTSAQVMLAQALDVAAGTYTGLVERGEQLVTRISEGMTEWTFDDGRVGYGLSEYLDQILDGKPVGVAE